MIGALLYFDDGIKLMLIIDSKETKKGIVIS
jgi:hypothetical protein